MTSDNFYYCICGMGFAAFLTSALSTFFRHGWKFPYNWYVGIQFYWAFSFAVYFPFWKDVLGEYVAARVGSIADAMISPLLMVAFVRFSHAVKKMTVPTLIVTFVPFVVAMYSFEYSDNVGLNIALFVLVAIVYLWWMVRILQRLKEYNDCLKNYVTDLADNSGKWFKWYLFLLVGIALLFFTYYFLAGHNDELGYDWTYVFDIFVALPLFVLFEYRMDRFHYFDNFDVQIAPAGYISDTLLSSKGMDRAMQLRTQYRARDLEHAQKVVRAMMKERQLVRDEESELVKDVSAMVPEQRYEEIGRRLECLERKQAFYVDRDLTLEKMSDMLGVNKIQLTEYMHFKGLTFFDYVTGMRVTYAVVMLDHNPDVLDENVAYYSGFRDVKSFREAFEDVYHMSVDKYRRELKE